MARARTRTKLPLDEWARILGLDPYHFNQIQLPTTIRETVPCDVVWKQHAWQEAAQLAREDIAQAISQAERMLENHLRFHLRPAWTVDERQTLRQPGASEILNIGAVDARGFGRTVKTDWGHFISGGIEAKTVILAGAAVVYSDQDGDGFDETATVTAATTVTDPDEIAVYYPGQSARDEWEIRPLIDPLTHRRHVIISAGTVTIRMPKYALVDEALLEDISPNAVDGEVNANFLATVDVYRHFNDPQQQLTFLWDPRLSFCDCIDGSCPACAHDTQTGCLLAGDFRRGQIHLAPATWNATTEQFDGAQFAIGRSPDGVRLWYYSGYQDRQQDAPNVEMEDELARAVAYLSVKFLQRPLCGCDNVQSYVRLLGQDLAYEIGTDAANTSYQLSDRVLLNPFGTERGAVMAWSIVNQDGVKQPVAHAVRL